MRENSEGERRGPTLRVLGYPSLALPGGARRPLLAADAAFLGLLAFRGSLGRAQVAEWMWPASPPANAQNSLRNRLTILRTWAGRDLFAKQEGALAFAEWVTHDLSSPIDALRHDPTALEAEPWDGLNFDNLQDLAREVHGAQRAWRARVHDALRTVATECELEGRTRLDHGVACVQRLLRQNPLDEPAVRLLMRLHHRRGDRAAALALFDEWKERAHAELEARPADETVELLLAISHGPVPSALAVPSLPPCLRHPPRTVGRRDVLAAARRRMDTGQSVVLTGPAGVGKSRLFDELLHGVDRDAVVSVVLRAGDSASALSPIAALARAVQRFLNTRPPGESHDAIKKAVARLDWLADPTAWPAPEGAMTSARLAALLRTSLDLAGSLGLRLVAIDNLHCAHPDSLTLLCDVLGLQGADGPGQPVLVTTCRTPLPEELVARLRPPSSLDGPEGPLLELGPLTTAAVQDLLESLQLRRLEPRAWGPAVFARSGGQPLAVLQLLRRLHDDGLLEQALPPQDWPLPSETTDRVLRVLDSGGDLVRQIAYVAALAQSDFTADLAERLVGVPAAALVAPWQYLKHAGVFDEEGFSHDLIRQVVHESIPTPLRAAMHAQIAQALHPQSGSGDRRAHHWEAAGQLARAATELAGAASELLAVGLVAAARERYLRAAGHYQLAGQPDAALECRLRALESTRGSTTLEEDSAELRRVLEQPLDGTQRARGLCLLSAWQAEAMDDAALETAGEALRLARDLANEALVVRASIRFANALRLVGRLDEALTLSQSLQLTEDRLSQGDRIEVELLRAAVLGTAGRRREALAAYRHLLDNVVRPEDDLYQAAEIANFASIQASNLDRLQESRHFTAQALAWSRRAGMHRSHLLVDEMNLVNVDVDLCEFTSALELGERVLRDMQAQGHPWQLNCESVLAGAYRVLGQHDRVDELMADAPADAPTFLRAFRLARQALMRHAPGPERLNGLRDAMNTLERGGVVLGEDTRVRIDLELARCVAPDQSLAVVERVRTWTVGNQAVGLRRMADRVAIEALLAGGRHLEAADAVDRYLADIDGQWFSYALYPPELWCLIVDVWLRAGRQDDAHALVRMARQWIDECAKRRVPRSCIEGFRRDNPFNLRLLAGLTNP